MELKGQGSFAPPHPRFAIAIRIQCPAPECRATCSAADTVSGRTVTCPKCGRTYVAKPTLDGRASDTKKSRPAPNENPFPDLPAEFGRYQVLKLLGRGGMGAVYLAQDSQLGRQVALKIPFFDASKPQRLQRFAREARSAAALHHPNICTVFDTGEIDGRPFLTMAYVEGTPLDGEIDADAPMPQPRAAEIVRKVALALDYAHRAGTVHRDLKPANVMMSADGEPVVMDFGLAKQVATADPNASRLTHDGGIMGTPTYMSPEQVRGDVAAIGPVSDVYALGVMLFELLAGTPPYIGPVAVVLGQIMSAPVPSVREFRPDADPRLDAICQRAMAKNPADRFTSMAALAQALDAYLKAPNAPASPPDPPPAPTPEAVGARAPKRSKWRPAALALVLALLAPLAVWLAGVVLRVETPEGTLVVEIDDPSVEARIKNGKLILSGPDGKDRYTLAPGERDKTIAAGPYKVRVEGADGLALDTTEFTLKKGDKVTVRVTLEAKRVPLGEPDKVAEKKGAPGEPGQVAGKQPPSATPDLPKTVVVNLPGGSKMEFVLIPKGRFTMGSPKDEKGRNPLKGPEGDETEHEVEITRPFYIGKYPVTQEQYQAVAGDTHRSWHTVNGGGKGAVVGMNTQPFPVEGLSWDMAKSYCALLTKNNKQGQTFRLPTEAEWEYACRAGTTTPFNFGSALNGRQANCVGHEPYGTEEKGPALNRTCVVGSYPANAWGLFDMHGNVHQWCEDHWGTYDGLPRTDPVQTTKHPKGLHVIRGGSYRDNAVDCRAARRHVSGPGASGLNRVGFRVVLSVDPSVNLGLDPDRRAAEYVLAVGGTVRINDQDGVKDVQDLPAGAFRLTGFDLGENRPLSDEALDHFKGCKNLGSLTLNGTQVTDAGMANLKDCKNLTTLAVSCTLASDKGLAHLGSCKT